MFNKKSYLISISLIVIFPLFGLVDYSIEKVNAKTSDEKVQYMLKQEYEYDLTKLIVVKKGKTKPELIKLEELTQEEGYISSKQLEKRGRENSDNEKRKEKLEKKLNELMNDKDIDHVQPVYLYSTDVWSRTEDLDTPDDFDLTPSASIGNHWYYEKSNLRSMWNAQDCYNDSENCGGSEDVVVAVIDTGLAFEDYTSVWPDNGSIPFDFDPATDMFVGDNINLWTNTDEIPNNDVDDDGNGYIDDYHGVNTENYIFCQFYACTTQQSGETGHPNDDGGHGTYVTGLISSLVNNNTGSVSPAHNVTIMPIKANFYKAPSFGTYELVEAINYATAEGADIINMSLAGPGSDYLLEQAINNAYDEGVVIIAASGNAGGGIYYPAKYPNVIAVGAVNPNNSKTGYSAYGPELDLVAYVGEVRSEGNSTYQVSYSCFTTGTSCYESTDSTRYKNFSYQYATGTSFAAPQVAAWAAIVLTNNPTYTNQQILELMQLNAIDLGEQGRDDLTGWGAVDFSESYNQVPDLIVITPSNLQESVGVYYEITWADEDEDNSANITFFTDNDDSGFDGNVIHTCSDILEDDETDTCLSDLRHLINGEYYIYGCIDDGLNEDVCIYAPGTININRTQQKQQGKEAVGSDWKSIQFDTTFTEKPVVIANISSSYEIGMSYLSVRNVTNSGFEIRIRENTMDPNVDDIHRGEMVDWMAVLGSDQELEVGYFSVDHNWKSINLVRSYVNRPKLLGMQQSINGSHLSHVDLKNLNTTGFEVRVEEPPGWDGIHTKEFVTYLTFNDIDGYQSGFSSTSHQWGTVTFPQEFENIPILMFQINTENGGQHVIPQIRNLTQLGFEFVMAEDPYFQDLVHTTEEISWIAFEYSGSEIDSEVVYVDHNWKNVVFENIFNTKPMIFTDIATENGGHTIEVDIKNVTNAGFTLRVEEDLVAGWDGIHTIERINWYAQIPTIIEGKEVQEITVNHEWSQLNFSVTYTNPMIFGEIQSENGGHTVALDLKKENDNNFVRLEEDIGAGWDGIHTSEIVGIMVLESPEVGCYGRKSIDADVNASWKDSVTFFEDNLGGSCNFSSVPKLFLEINSENGRQTVQVDINNLTSAGFQVRLEEENNYDKIHTYEDVVWYAF